MSQSLSEHSPAADGTFAMIENAFEFFGTTDREREVLATSVEVMGSQEGARAWLRTCHPALGGKAPRNQATSAAGHKRVLRLLGAIANGYEA